MLAGAKFKLLNFEGKIIKEDLVTNKDGVITIEGLKEGDYQLVEVQAPTGYILDETAINFSVNKNTPLVKLTKLNTKINKELNVKISKDALDSGYSLSTYTPTNLPKTGEKNSMWLVPIGIITIMTGIWFVKRKNK